MAMSDDELVGLFEPGKQYSRSQILKASDLTDLVMVSQRLGKLRAKNRLVKSPSGWWSLPGTKQVKTGPTDDPVIRASSDADLNLDIPSINDSCEAVDRVFDHLKKTTAGGVSDGYFYQLPTPDSNPSLLEVVLQDDSEVSFKDLAEGEFVDLPLPDDLRRSFGNLERLFALSNPKKIDNFTLKQQVLFRLSQLLDPSISNVLQDVQHDLSCFQKLTGGQSDGA
ncbi:hypothetical protein [Neptunicella sp.]|uniref:hypothetical protein n=1 Tax=Neptunicella sp. TaxID=2125986 RepID=UPI003F68F1D0